MDRIACQEPIAHQKPDTACRMPRQIDQLEPRGNLGLAFYRLQPKPSDNWHKVRRCRPVFWRGMFRDPQLVLMD
jgi:hypothetical protein